MTNEELRSEKLYQATMCMVKKLLQEGVITAGEYEELEDMFAKKYKPVIGKLYTAIYLL